MVCVVAVGLATGCSASVAGESRPSQDNGLALVTTLSEKPQVITRSVPEPVIVPAVFLTDDELAALPRPVINTILPADLPQAQPEDLLPLAAIPVNELTPGSIEPGGQPVLALEADTNTVIEPITGRWTVVGQEPGWVRVMVPVGRRVLPSEADAPGEVNHAAVWVPADAVTLQDEEYRVVVSLSERTLTLYRGDREVATSSVGIGVESATETPLGLCTIIARVLIQTGDEALLTSCQSEDMDGFAGVNWATIAIHEGYGFSLQSGGAVSAGCIRVTSAKFHQYLDDLRIGTPMIVIP